MKKTAIFIALSIVTLVSVSMLLTNYSDNVKYDSNKVHHGKNSFKTKRSASIFQWLSMRFKEGPTDRKSTRLNSSHALISYAVFCLKKKKKKKKKKRK